MGRMKDLVSDDWDRAYRHGYVDALGTARAAMTALDCPECSVDAALAVIDALQEKRSRNPDNPTSAEKADKPGERRHLFECFMRDSFTINRPGICICDRLRGFEQRMKRWWLLSLDEYEDVKRRAYFAGLDAAREAVAALTYGLGIGWPPDSEWVNREHALAAIDALRDPAIPTPDDGNAGTEQIADPALRESPRQDR